MELDRSSVKGNKGSVAALVQEYKREKCSKRNAPAKYLPLSPSVSRRTIGTAGAVILLRKRHTNHPNEKKSECKNKAREGEEMPKANKIINQSLFASSPSTAEKVAIQEKYSHVNANKNASCTKSHACA